MLAASVAFAFVLHATSTLVEFQVGQLYDVEGIGHLDGLGHSFVEDTAVGAREVAGGVADVRAPLLAACFDPRGGGLATATRHDVEELTTTHVDDRRREDQAPVGAVVHEEHLVETEGLDVAEAMLVIINERFTVTQEGVVHGVPGAAQLLGDLFHAAPVLADLAGQPSSGAIGRQVTREGNAAVLLGPGPHRTGRVSTTEPTHVPNQADRTSVDRQVHEGDRGPVLHPGDHATLGTAHHRSPRFEVDGEGLSVVALDA